MKMLKQKTSFLKFIGIFTFAASIVLVLQFYQCKAYAQGTFPGAVRYTVKSGDSLYLIASRNDISVDVLKTVNGLDTNQIMPGQVLNLPGSTGSGFVRYTIVPGDSLYTISRKFGVAINNIKLANNISSDVITSGQVLIIPYLQQKSLASVLSSKGINPASAKVDIVVDKSEHTLLLFSKGTWLKTYHIEIGNGGLSDKQILGDRKTPEGSFYVCQESVLKPVDQYLGTRWMRLSYPNLDDAVRGLNKGLISQATYNAIKAAINQGDIPPQDTPLGAGVGIHGGNSPSAGIDWTWGCISLTNNDVEELFDYVGTGTRVLVQK